MKYVLGQVGREEPLVQQVREWKWQPAVVWCVHTTGGSSCTIASRGRERGFWKSCEVRHVMEDQSLPLASWKQVREWKFQPPPGVCGAARQPVAPLLLAAFSLFSKMCEVLWSETVSQRGHDHSNSKPSSRQAQSK